MSSGHTQLVMEGAFDQISTGMVLGLVNILGIILFCCLYCFRIQIPAAWILKTYPNHHPVTQC